ncbi:putative wall-associated receptor kinase-like 16 [Phoenix dactylifera]|uniref:Wall-associated receptor kinase-like 16 n=1 Tax=Phoenix dactylifera TaxID=42345 RepID=A0A8B8J7B5_PHODC|nr:putative wall-associated receptor kinase-like 16 [Phoenix dactylifera]
MVWAAALLLRLASVLAAAAAATPDALHGCQAKCGNVTVPYPFGIGKGCFMEGFDITCNESVAYLSDTNIDVVKINLTEGLLVVNQYMAQDCYSKDGKDNDYNIPSINITGMPYKFSDSRNKFMAVGCDTLAVLRDDELGLKTGCITSCNSTRNIPSGTCAGIGCCETPIPKGLTAFEVIVDGPMNHTNCWDFNPCSYGFLADEGWLNFSVSSFSYLRNLTNVPVTLDWAIGNQSCEEASTSSPAFACKAKHSLCLNSTNGPGYRCNCSVGFEGNPYMEDGCQDIDECMNKTSCVSRCKNTPGNYTCSCPWDKYGDGRKDGSGCKSIWKLVYLALGGAFGLVFLIILCSWLYWIIKKKRLIELKEKFFQKNGGLLLRQQVSSLEGGAPATRMFTMEELEMATDNYKESRILGQGGAGTVYKGILPDQIVVAIKKSKITDDDEIEQFINEVVVLSHINHRNVVKLLGCCLETRVPLLVYEFVPNGTLSHHIHDEDCKASLSLEARLRIAAEIAGALAYLHSEASIAIIHRDVKSSNILLDDNYTAKVSDFGVSRLVPFDRNGLTSLVRGTFGYLDPEYFHTAQFTDKSDVYSFGVILVELLTGEKPVASTRPTECRNLTIHFKSCLKDGRLFPTLEDRVVDEGSPELLVAVAELAKRCLSLMGEERPAMKEVAVELEGMRRFHQHPWIEENEEEGECLLKGAECPIPSRMHGEDDSSVHAMQPFDIMR